MRHRVSNSRTYDGFEWKDEVVHNHVEQPEGYRREKGDDDYFLSQFHSRIFIKVRGFSIFVGAFVLQRTYVSIIFSVRVRYKGNEGHLCDPFD